MKAKKAAGLIVSAAVLFALVAMVTVAGFGKAPEPDTSDLFRIIRPNDWELEVGDSRSVDYAFAEDITDRLLSWEVIPSKIASVDKWGRVTARAEGAAVVRATTSGGLKSDAVLSVVDVSAAQERTLLKKDYEGKAVAYGSNYQKIVTRYALGEDVPGFVAGAGEDCKTAITADGAVWTITDYGVMRYDESADNPRDAEQLFMGNRYFYDMDTTDGKVKAILADGENGIWTVTENGYTHIEMTEMSGADKAALMAKNTETYVQRRGMVSEAYYNGDEWVPHESDNDGLWTSMYAAGEVMRYATLKESGTASSAEIAEARRSATIATEAVLLLSNISMRKGTAEAYIRYQPNAAFDEANGRYYSEEALEKSGDYSINLPMMSPSDMYSSVYETYFTTGKKTYILTEEYMEPFSPDDWSNPRTESGEYETRTRNLEGYIARTYSFKEEGNDLDGYAYWQFNGDGTATGVSTKKEGSLGYYLNGENLRGTTVDASGEIPERLWNDLIGEGYTVGDIVYKGDTSSDEVIGHLFLYKLAFDVLGSEDDELRKIISDTMDNFAQHVSDNSYMMVDGSGQPGTWSKYNREFFENSSQLGGAPLTASVALSIFKLASYVTGYQKWENEYRMAALDSSYEYAELMTQYGMQCELLMVQYLSEFLGDEMSSALLESLTEESKEMLLRLFLNYSDEEMAMLAFYLLFQMETDETLLSYYRAAIDEWWVSIKYSENPLWYSIYQLAYPDKLVVDAYGNNIAETVAWSLSRHPIDTRKYLASNGSREDVAVFSLKTFGLDEGEGLSYDLEKTGKLAEKGSMFDAISVVLSAENITWKVAPPDERSMHKYNGSSYDLAGNVNEWEMEGATTFTLPYWLARYHGIISD